MWTIIIAYFIVSYILLIIVRIGNEPTLIRALLGNRIHLTPSETNEEILYWVLPIIFPLLFAILIGCVVAYIVWCLGMLVMVGAKKEIVT